jgi:hypothetical protein
VIDDTKVFNAKVREWEDCYHCHHPTPAWAAQPPANDYSIRPRPACKRSPVSFAIRLSGSQECRATAWVLQKVAKLPQT